MDCVVATLLQKMTLIMILALVTLPVAVSLSTLVTNPTQLITASSKALSGAFYDIDLHTMQNLRKVLQLYREHTVDAAAFHGVNGYGYGDIGREKLDLIVAKLMGAEKAMVRLQFFSGTHAIAKALFTALRPGNKLLGVSGKPYDTLEEVIGLRPASNTGNYAGSLKDWGITYDEIDLEIRDVNEIPTAFFDLEKIRAAVDNDPTVKVIHIQRYVRTSCHY